MASKQNPKGKTIKKSTRSTKKSTASKGKNRYSDKDLAVFKAIIMEKMEEAKKELTYLHDTITHMNEHGTDDTGSSFKSLEDAPNHTEKEYLHQMSERQHKFIDHLEKALVRIENKSYGICRQSGKLISKKRLKAVPHATLSIEAKLNRV